MSTFSGVTWNHVEATRVSNINTGDGVASRPSSSTETTRTYWRVPDSATR